MPKILSFGMLRCWLACLTLLGASTSAQVPSDSWFARSWRTDDGLPDNAVHSVAQTADGYIWATTDGGLARFDGARFQKFPLSNIASNNALPAKLFVDSRARFWLALNRGAIICLDTNSSRIFTTKDGLPETYPVKLVEDGDRAVWIAYAGAQKAYRIRDGVVEAFGAAEGLPRAGNTWELTTDVNGVLWFARGREVGVFRGGKFHALVNTRLAATRITQSAGGGVWFCAGTEIYRFKEGGEAERHGRLPDGSVIMTLFEDSERTLWVGTEVHGLFRLNGTKLESVRTSHRGISRLIEDREGNLWVGTLGGGLNRLRPRVVELIDADAGLPVESLRSVCKDTNGMLWVVTRNARVLRREGEMWVDVSALPEWPGGNAYCIAAGPAGDVWIGTWGRGLYRYDKGTFTRYEKKDGLAAEWIRSLMFAANGDLWMGVDLAASGASTLQRRRADEWRTYDLPGNPRLLRTLAEDTSGNIWAGCGNGRLYRVTGDNVFNETGLAKTNQPVGIRSLAATKDGSVWVGYPGSGLGWIKDGCYARITSAQGLSDDYISQIIDDGHGWLWFCGGSVVFKVEQRELLDAVQGRLGHIRSIVYGRGEGVSGLQAAFEAHPATLRDSDDRLYVATRMGLGIIHTRRLKDNPEPPLVLIDRVSTNGQALATYDSLAALPPARMNGVVNLRDRSPKIELRPDHRRVEIGFTAMSFTAPENVHFRYRLSGIDDEWVEAGPQRSANYPQLPAGDYKFQVIACNNSGLWNQTGATLNFAVLPFFWQTWTFRIATLAAFTLTVVAFVRYFFLRRLRQQLRLLEQQAALHKERARIAKDIHDDLGGNLTQITLLGDLAHQDIAAPEKADAHILKISQTAREVVKSLDEIVWAVNPRNDTLSHLIDYIGQFTSDYLRVPGVRCRLDLPENPPERNIPADIRHNLFLVVKEALNNVVKHAQASEVWLRVNVTNGSLRVVIEDNGRGFDRAPQDARADGLRNMRNRLSDIGGECQIESRAGAGTKIMLDVPWQKS